MGDVIDLVLVQADALHQIDLDLVAGREAAHERRAVQAAMLRHGQHRRDVVAGMRVVGGEERVVKVELAHGDAVGPAPPIPARPGARVSSAGRTRSRPAGRMRQRLRARA